jgi:hypothetical protein
MAKKKPLYIRNLLKMRPKLRKLETELASVKASAGAPTETRTTTRYHFTIDRRLIALVIGIIAIAAIWYADPILTITTTTTITETVPGK